MELHCTLVVPDAGHLQSGLARRDIVVDIARGTSGSVIQSELTERYGVGPLAVGGSALEDLAAGTPPLCSGAVLLP